jgi:hypothetical protein
MFDDASGSGFGSALMIGNDIHFLHGQWSSSFAHKTTEI